jgi:TonB family protein
MRAAWVAIVLSSCLAARVAGADEAPQLSKPPRLVRFVEAEAPPALTERGQADVILTLDVDEQGRVQSVAVARPAGDGFDEAAVAAARQFVFEPGEADGHPVPVRITYRYRFLLKPASASASPSAPAPSASAGPTIPVEGQVLVRGDRVPVAGISVVLDGGALEAHTDDDGRFHFAAVPVGEHAFKLRGGGIAPVDGKLQANAGKRLQLTYYVALNQRYSSTVRGKRPVVETVEQTLSADEIKRIPGTQGDALKSVQNLPGVARAPFGLGLLIVWGSSPQDTRAYVDGVYIPTLYHFGGLRSTLNSEMVQSLTFTPGGYGVDHGRGLGGIVDVDSRKPRTDGYHGYAQLDLIDASAMVEGPIGKKLSFAAALRRSIIDVFLPIFTRGSNFQLSTVYYDYQARLTYRPNRRDDLDLFFFGSDDEIDLLNRNSNAALSAQFGSHTYYHRGVFSWLHRFAHQGTFSMIASIGYDVPFQLRFVRGEAVSSIDAGTTAYTLRAIGRIPLTSFLRLDAGVDYEGNRFTLDRTTESAAGFGGGDGGGDAGGGGGPGGGRGGGGMGGGGASSSPDRFILYTDHVAPYLSAVLSFFDQRLTINPQLRLEVLTFAGYQGTPNAFSSAFVRAEPRLLARYQALRWMAVKLAIGVFDQPPQPQNLSVVFGNPKLIPESGVHYVAGFDFQPTPTLHIEIEGFYKDLRNLIVPGEHPGDPLFVNESMGRVYGGQLLVRQELWKNFWGWISYTLSRSERKDHPDQDWRIFQFDQTHILTLIASYKLPRGYQLGVRFRYVTGNPYTPVMGAYFNSNTDRYTPILAPLDSGRLGSFNQLDIRFDKTWTFNLWRLSIYADLQNIYDASNPEGITYNYNYTHPSTINSLPFLPVLGVRGDF